MNETALQKVQTIIEAEFQIDPEKITREAGLIVDLGLDSIDCVELLMAVEDTYGIEVDDRDAEEWQTVGDIVDYLEKQAV